MSATIMATAVLCARPNAEPSEIMPTRPAEVRVLEARSQSHRFLQ